MECRRPLTALGFLLTLPACVSVCVCACLWVRVRARESYKEVCACFRARARARVCALPASSGKQAEAGNWEGGWRGYERNSTEADRRERRRGG